LTNANDKTLTVVAIPSIFNPRHADHSRKSS
jgi:hypothetical protein